MQKLPDLRLKCPCCGTLVKTNRVGKVYDLEVKQVLCKGYKDIRWIDIDPGFRFKRFWIDILLSALKRLGYRIPRNKVKTKMGIPREMFNQPRVRTKPTIRISVPKDRIEVS